MKGKRQQIAGADTKVTSNEWHTLALRADGERFTVEAWAGATVALFLEGCRGNRPGSG